MIDELSRLLAVNGYLPHGYCLSWSPPLLATYLVSDILIFLSYASIAVALGYFARRRTDLPYRWVLWLFAAFIMACGTTHLMGAIVLWQPLYGLDALFKAVTALISVATATLLWPLIPHVLKLPSPGQLRQANKDLQDEIALRKGVEEELRAARAAAEIGFRRFEERFSKVFHDSPDGATISEVETGLIREINPSHTAIFGYTAEEVVGRTAVELGLWAKEAERDEMVSLMKKDGFFRNQEMEHRTKDGRVLTLLASATRMEEEGTPCWLLQFRDITRRKQAEKHMRKLSRIVEQSPVSVMITDLQGNIEYANPRCCEVSGYSSEELMGTNPRILQSGQTPAHTYGEMWASIMAGHEWHGDLLNRKKNGELYWESGVVTPITDATGAVTNFVAVKEDITERKRAEEELLRLNRTLTMLSECNQALVRSTDETELLDSICRQMTEIGGYVGVWVRYAEDDQTRRVGPGTLAGMPDDEPATLGYLGGIDGDTVGALTDTAIRTGQVAMTTHHDPANQRFDLWREATIRPERFSAASLPLKADGRVIGAVSICAYTADAFDAPEMALLRELADDIAYGIMARREAVERRRVEEELLLSRRAIESSNEGIVINDLLLLDRPIIFVNSAFENITGYTAAEALGRNFGFLLVRDDTEQVGVAEIRAAQREQRAAKTMLRSYRKDGSMFWNELSWAPVHDEFGQARYSVSIINDITERKSYETQLEYQANYDALTGLANRNLLADRLEQAIAHAKRDKRLVAVMLLDLDRFKVINDGLGHDAGDALLKIVAQRLAACVRSVDTVARLGGDEFVVIMTDMDSEHDAVPLAHKLLDQISRPMTIADREIVANASLGMAIYPKDAKQAAVLLKNADVAMYHAKELGRNTLQFYAPEMNARTLARLELDTALRRAVERDELVLYYQPKVELQRGKVVGAEALIRWRHPRLGLVSPADFIPLAEETGLIVPIGEWVINNACAQLKAWQSEGLPAIGVAVNLSARQFQQENLARIVAQALRLNDVRAHYLELELTESAVMQNPTKTEAIMRELKKIGVNLSLDDFGTGYSSLSYLKRFPIDILKIDQSFVRDITTDPDGAAISLAVISLAHSLKQKVVAEGVETEAQLGYLRRHGCDEMQGYYFSRPLPADEFARLLREGRSLSLGLNMDE